MTIKRKILTLSITTNILLWILIFTTVLITTQRQNSARSSQLELMLIEQKKEYLQDIVKNAFAILSEYAESSAEPDSETIIRLLSKPRYDVDESAYFFAYQINNDGTYSFAFHATKPQLNGKKTNIDNPDVNGVKFRRLLIEGSQKGENFVEYTYAKGKQDNLQPKLSYSLHLKEWNWVLVGGIYLDNVAAARAEMEAQLNRELRTVLITITVISLAVMLLTILGTLYFGNRIARPITEITGVIAKIADGKTDISVEQDQTAEIGAMQQSLQKLIESFIKKSQFANAVAEGDLSQHIEASSEDDSLGKALIIMQENLKKLIDDINIIAGGVVSGAKEVMDASTTLSQGATEQAASAEQINSSLVVIKDETDRNADDARKAEVETTETRGATNNGVTSINQLNDAMQTIIDSSQEIYKVIKTIDEIAFQTNLLALNAAIEAARAGKFGKSFKVVADEVRSLANKSATAAKETTALIEGAIGSVSKGESVVESTREMLIEVTERINNLTNLTDSIARSSMDQAQGITEVTGGVDQISKVTQSNAAQSEETASSAQELHSLAKKLKSAVEHFTLE